MAGRGRGLTLPAWMTSGELQPITSTDSAPISNVSNEVAPVTRAPEPARTSSVPMTATNSLPRAPSMTQFKPAFQPPPAMPAHLAFNGGAMYGSMVPPMMPPMAPANFMNMHQPYPNMHVNTMGNMNAMGNMGNFPPHMHMGGGAAMVPAPNLPAAPPGGMPMPYQPRPPTTAAPTIDPNNDVSCWAEHESDTGKKYWYNRVSLVSTYDKPFCLKTPEERSIPPCAWKEYASADGKKYYSNGKESLWTMPEEFRLWKEKMDALELKKVTQAAAKAEQAEIAATAAKEAPHSAASGGHSNTGSARAENLPPAIVYASQAEAAEAFKELLANMNVTTIAKMKEVQDLCQHDQRWDALKSQGEKKQALAEYQTKRLKQEKENQKLKARKQRDAFLLMLAENTDIDARTRWRDATAILQDDARYKNVEDARDREELFQEFIVELEKKEKEDQRRLREAATAQFSSLLKDFAEEGKIGRKSIWADCKKLFLDVIVKAEYRALDDSDFRRCFQSFTAELEESFRAAEKRRKAEFDKALSACQGALRSLLEEVAHSGLLTVDTRWKELVVLDAVAKSEAFKNMKALFASEEDQDGSRFSAAAKDVFDTVQAKVYEQFKLDKRLVKDVLGRQDWKITHTATFGDFKTLLLRVARVQEVDAALAVEEGPAAVPAAVSTDDQGPQTAGSGSVKQVLVEPVMRGAGGAEEEGEEVDELPAEQVRAMLLERPTALALIFKDLHAKALADFEEEQARAAKVEKKFLSVLAENFYKLEHAAVPWEDAKKVLQRRSVYDDLSKADKKRLFAQHMAELAVKGGLPPPASASGHSAGGSGSGSGTNRRSVSRDKRQRSSSYSRPRDRAHAPTHPHAHAHGDRDRDRERERERDRARDSGRDNRGRDREDEARKQAKRGDGPSEQEQESRKKSRPDIQDMDSGNARAGQ